MQALQLALGQLHIVTAHMQEGPSILQLHAGALGEREMTEKVLQEHHLGYVALACCCGSQVA